MVWVENQRPITWPRDASRRGLAASHAGHSGGASVFLPYLSLGTDTRLRKSSPAESKNLLSLFSKSVFPTLWVPSYFLLPSFLPPCHAEAPFPPCVCSPLACLPWAFPSHLLLSPPWQWVCMLIVVVGGVCVHVCVNTIILRILFESIPDWLMK